MKASVTVESKKDFELFDAIFRAGLWIFKIDERFKEYHDTEVTIQYYEEREEDDL